jgi:hypothetical protein
MVYKEEETEGVDKGTIDKARHEVSQRARLAASIHDCHDMRLTLRVPICVSICVSSVCGGRHPLFLGCRCASKLVLTASSGGSKGIAIGISLVIGVSLGIGLSRKHRWRSGREVGGGVDGTREAISMPKGLRALAVELACLLALACVSMCTFVLVKQVLWY